MKICDPHVNLIFATKQKNLIYGVQFFFNINNNNILNNIIQCNLLIYIVYLY